MDPHFQRIFAELITRGPDVTVDELAGALDVESAELLQELLTENGGLDRAEETINGSVNSIRARSANRRLAAIDEELPLASAEDQDALIREKRRLMADIQALGSPRWKGFNSPRPHSHPENT
jgi:hypothetical protein